MGEQQRRTSWVFDSPLLRDGLFWSGLTLGVLLAVWETSSVPYTELPLAAQVSGLVWQVLAGVLAVGVVGGSVRHFVRGYRGTPNEGQHATAGSGGSR